MLLGGEHGSPRTSREDTRVIRVGFVISADGPGAGGGMCCLCGARQRKGLACKCREPRSGIISRESSSAMLSQNGRSVNSAGSKKAGGHPQSQSQSGAVQKTLQKRMQLPHLLPRGHVLTLCLSTQGCNAAWIQRVIRCRAVVSALHRTRLGWGWLFCTALHFRH